MARHTTIATAIDKHKISSNVVYLTLLEFEIIDPITRSVVEVFRIVNNNENYQWRDNSYLASYFEFDLVFEQDKPPTVSLVLKDVLNIIQPRMQAYGGMMGSKARMIVINTSVADSPPELDHVFNLISAVSSGSDYNISFQLGAENPLGLRFPPRLQYSDRCFFQYKGIECGYSGSMPSCSFTQEGENGCKAHGNINRFGGFPGLRS